MRSRKSRKVRRSRSRTKKKQKGCALPIIVPLAVVGGGYYLWKKHMREQKRRPSNRDHPSR